jgi:Lon protease-like protein
LLPDCGSQAEGKRFVMTRELPPKPNLEHLKAQAKDLLDAHRRGEPQAFARIRAAVPAFARRSDEEIARGPFALHDAQSAIAREYGCASWADLRTKVAAAGGTPQVADPEISIQALSGRTLPPEIEATIRAAIALRGNQNDAPTPASVPVLPVRNAVVFPGTMLPLDISRPPSLRAIEAAMQGEPHFLAVFAQRSVDIERPTREDLHPTGCLCVVRVVHHWDDGAAGPGEPPRPVAWIFIEGVRWVRLESLDQTEPYYLARVADTDFDRGDDQQIAALDRRLRELAHRFADTMGAVRDRVKAAIDQTAEPRQLADLVMANFPVPVADKAAYAEESQLSRKLDLAIALLTTELAKAEAAAPA